VTAGASDAMPSGALTVGIDFAQPQSYLAHGPTRALAAARGISIDWQPMAARSLQEPASETLGESRGARHRRMRARYVETDLRRYAEAQGLTLGDLGRRADSSLAGMALLWVKRHAERAGGAATVDAFVGRVFDGYWGDTLAIEDPAALQAVMGDLGLPAPSFDPTAVRDEHQQTIERWRAVGAVEAPAYRVGDEVFIGRAHLPMIEWLLGGRVGPAPA
jgi:2-hydroxychromene-2-carboxylate isomerase